MKKLVLCLSLMAVVLPLLAADQPNPEHLDTFKVKESFNTISVYTRAPYPPEIENETQRRALAKDAAVALGQNSIRNYILKKRTRKYRTLEEAMIPSTETQDRVKTLIVGAKVDGVQFDEQGCRLRVWIDKSDLKVIRKKG